MEEIKKAYEVCSGEGDTSFGCSVPVRVSIVDEAYKQTAHSKIRSAFDEGIPTGHSQGGSISDGRHHHFRVKAEKEMIWHKRFLGMAEHIGQWSKDPSTKLGAVIVDDKQRIVSTGYNGFPRGVDDTYERLEDRDMKYALTVHAEMNAMSFATQDLEGTTLYVTPIGPCARCAVVVIQNGIKKVFSPKLTPDLEERWGASLKITREIFAEAGVEWTEL